MHCFTILMNAYRLRNCSGRQRKQNQRKFQGIPREFVENKMKYWMKVTEVFLAHNLFRNRNFGFRGQIMCSSSQDTNVKNYYNLCDDKIVTC